MSTPAEQGLDQTLVGELYHHAAELETLYGLLVVKNDHLIAEGYFIERSVDKKNQLKSVTKSYSSALVGIALDQGCLTSVEQKMVDFSALADYIFDPKKREITIMAKPNQADFRYIKGSLETSNVVPVFDGGYPISEALKRSSI